MEITQSFALAHPPERVWQYLRDIALVAECMPGAELDEVTDDQSFRGRINVRLGPIAAAFRGQGETEWNDAARTGVVRGRGQDSRTASRVEGVMSFALQEEEGGAASRVDLGIDFKLTGSLAQFGRAGVVNDVASRLTQEFAKQLEARIDAESGAAAPAGEPEAAPAAPERPRELRVGGMLWQVLLDRIKTFFRRLFGRA